MTASDFRTLYGKEPEALGRAPGRVNLIGDHTDYNDGFVLPTAIPQETQVEIARGKDLHRAYSVTLARGVTFTDSTAALPDFARYAGGCLRVLAARGVSVPPLDIRITSDVPVGAGLSSSAALSVATLRAVARLLDLSLDPMETARLAWEAETQYAGVACGIMDQVACSLADTQSMILLDTRTLDRRLLPLPDADLLVIDSGVPRALAESKYNERRAECEKATSLLGVSSLRDIDDLDRLEALPEPLQRRARHVVSENFRVRAAVGADPAEFGRLMNGSHGSLRDDYEVSVPAVDGLVAALQSQPEVYGARITGAGFGGACVALTLRGTAAAVGARIVDRGSPGTAPRVIVPCPP